MTPPGLTCVRCERHLYPELARATNTGWAHIECTSANICATCDRGLVPDKQWRSLTTDERAEALARNMARKGKDAACHRCYLKSKSRVTQAERREEEARERAARLEDIEWLADTGESWDMAVIRLGLNDSTLDNFLRTHKRLDLMVKLRGSRVAA